MGFWEKRYWTLEMKHQTLGEVSRKDRNSLDLANSKLLSAQLSYSASLLRIDALQQVVDSHKCPEVILPPLPERLVCDKPHARPYALSDCMWPHVSVYDMEATVALRKENDQLREKLNQARTVRGGTEQEHLDAQKIRRLTDKNAELQDTIRKVLNVVRPETGPCNPQ